MHRRFQLDGALIGNLDGAVPSLPIKVGVGALTCQSRSRLQCTRLPHAIVRQVRLTVLAKNVFDAQYGTALDATEATVGDERLVGVTVCGRF